MTVEACRDNDRPALRLPADRAKIERVLQALSEPGVDLEAMVARLLDGSTEKFMTFHDASLQTLERARRAGPG